MPELPKKRGRHRNTACREIFPIRAWGSPPALARDTAGLSASMLKPRRRRRALSSALASLAQSLCNIIPSADQDNIEIYSSRHSLQVQYINTVDITDIAMVIRQDTNGLGYPHRAFPLTKRQFVMRPGGGGRVDVLAIRGWGGGRMLSSYTSLRIRIRSEPHDFYESGSLKKNTDLGSSMDFRHSFS